MVNLCIRVEVGLRAGVRFCQLILGVTLIENFAMSWLVY